MRTRLSWLLPGAAGLSLLLGLALVMVAWLGRNPFPDGYQNEYLHVGNAFDLWRALVELDGWHLRYYTARNYWPPLFYMVPWPILALMGMGRDALVLGNLFWLALALGAVAMLARDRVAAVVAMAVLALSPGLFGTMVRYEPNVAQVACVAVGLLALRRSEGFTHRGWSLTAGATIAVGLLTDRLGTAPFLALPVLAMLIRPGTSGPRWRNIAMAGGLVLLVAGPWYVNWVAHELSEVTSQLYTGEIDSTGTLTEPDGVGPLRWLYYPLALLDSQAGPVLGAVMLLGLLLRPRRDLLLTVVGGWLLFSFIEKKQVFYTLPLLAPLAVLAGDAASRMGRARFPVALLLLLAGLDQHAARMWGRGLVPALAHISGPDPLPDAWVAPRHPLARPPVERHLPLDELRQLLGPDPGEMTVFSYDEELWEGFVHLRLRETWPGASIRSLRMNPQGTFEWFRSSKHFLVLGPAPAWPGHRQVEQALLNENYNLGNLPPLPQLIAMERTWTPRQQWRLRSGTHMVLWVSPDPPDLPSL